MVLKKIEAFGFKSFADRTLLDLHDGITAIVGPNGCGKSNVSDAIRWVLGEQSAKSLRGESMEDVIFNGTVKRPPLGFAEVTLTFDNTHKIFPLEFNEVSIGRRLFRDGESGYFINKQDCRLRDIHDLMMDSGIGRRQHAIIEQGRIEEIVTARPEERRQIIEEAAGISKYRSRRAEALRKLEATREGLRRVDDLIAEMERQESALRRQSKKAEKYREVETELRGLEIALASHRIAAIRARQSEMDALTASYQDEITAAETETATIAAAIERDELALAEARERLREAGRDVSDAERAAMSVEVQQQELRARLEDDAATIDRLSAEIDVLTREITNDEAARADAQASAAALEEEAGRLGALRAEITRELEAALAALNENAAREVSLSERHASAARDIVRLRAELAHGEQAEARAAERLAASERLGEKFREEDRGLEEERGRLDGESGRLADDLVGLQNAQRSLEQDLAAADHAIERDAEDVHLEERRLAVLRHRLDSAQSRARSAAEELLRHAADQASGVTPVADADAFAPELTAAFTAALGDALFGVIAAEESPVALDRLAQKLRGKPVLRSVPVESGQASWVPQSGLTPLRDLLGPSAPPALRPLLAGWYLVEAHESLDTVLALLDDRERLVTREGDVYWPSGARRAGIAAEGDSVLAGRHALAAEVRAQEELLSARRAALDDARVRRAELARNLTANEGLRREVEARAAQIQRELATVRDRLASDRVRRIESEIGEAARELDGVRRARTEAVATLSRREADALAAQADRSAAFAALEDSRLSVDAVRERARAAENEENIARERHAGRLAEAVARMERIEATTSARGRHGSLRDDLARRRVASEAQLEALRIRSAELARALDSVRAIFHAADADVASRAAALTEIQKSARDAAARRETARDGVHALEMERVEISGEVRRIAERMMERYSLDAETLPAPDAAAAAPDEARVIELREMMARLGAVNFAAAEELAVVEERLGFYRTQREDLTRADQDLAHVVSEIDEKTLRLFKETFSAVNANFGLLFNRLFASTEQQPGAAELLLLDPDNPLESGIDIIAMPPGKKPQSITLLSGGEKAMTAIALLFAVFLVRPSPFAILDELDAPLDEANVERFTRVLKEFSQRTQFIVVTHNKRTMEMANTLYGVAMPERGVSTLFSVRLAEAEGLAEAVG